jgi:hypothetical protein
VSAPTPGFDDAQFLEKARENVRKIFASDNESLIDELTDLLVDSLQHSQLDKMLGLRAFFGRAEVKKLLA